MARLGRNGFLAIAVLFHLIYCYSIFDIYFVSPIVSGMRAFRANLDEPPAKRLFLFVGDGLRADKAFQSFPDPSPEKPGSPEALEPRPLAPFIRSKVLNEGTFGVSHTRVPTESRPGHVALIAGLYEDVSAVTTGWKLNPVNFDSVFNRSRHTWSWGSPDILPMFEHGAVPGRVYADTYPPEFEDSSMDASFLDTWVFDKVKDLFSDARKNQPLAEALNQDRNVFFLHLLGLDTTGHAYRPYSKEYLHNIKVVDKGVQEIVQLVEEYYGDGKTAFVFTADHGMSDWGSHGDGHPDNTRTPLVAWGSGVAKPIKWPQGDAPGHRDGFSHDWGFNHIQRHDVAQADVAALMAHLVGLEFPVNSVGELPLEFLDATPRTKASALLANAQEILEMYHVKDKQKAATELRYVPFPQLASQGSTVEERIETITKLIHTENYEDAIAQSRSLIKSGLDGLRYLQTYDWLFLRVLVTAGYLGWIAFALTTVIDLNVLHGKVEITRSTQSVTAFASILVALFSLLYIQSSALTYYAYALFPVLFWEEVWASRDALAEGRKKLLGHITTAETAIPLATQTCGFILLLEALVQSYYHREVYTVLYIAAAAWPAFYGKQFLADNKLLTGSWTVACVILSSFTLLPVVKTESINLILLGGGFMCAVGILYLLYEKNLVKSPGTSGEDIASPQSNYVSRTVLGIQVGLVLLAMIVTRSSVISLKARTGLPLGTQVVGWLVLIASLTVPFLHSLQPNNDYVHRLVVIFLTFSPAFIILTISYEGLFYFTFCVTLFLWVQLEHRILLSAGQGSDSKSRQETTKWTEQSSTTANGHSSQSANGNGKLTANGTNASKTGKPGTSQHTPTPSNPFPAPSSNALEPSLSQKLQSTSPHRALTLEDLRPALFTFYLIQSAFFSTGNIASISSFSLDAVYRLIPVFDPFSQGALLVLKLLIPFAAISAVLAVLSARLKIAPSALLMLVTALSDYLTVRFFWAVRDEGSWLEIGTSISVFCIASALCVFLAGLEWVGQIMAGGVEFAVDDGVSKGANRSSTSSAGDEVEGIEKLVVQAAQAHVQAQS